MHPYLHQLLLHCERSLPARDDISAGASPELLTAIESPPADFASPGRRSHAGAARGAGHRSSAWAGWWPCGVPHGGRRRVAGQPPRFHR